MKIYYNFTDPKVIAIDIVVIIILLIGVYSGYKKGFLESAIRFIGVCASFIVSYLFKNPISVYLYKNLPFFKIGGFFKGVTVLNILIYEVIAFIILFTVCLIILKILGKLTGIVDKALSFIFLIGVPNKLLGSVMGFISAYIVIYFAGILFTFGCSFLGYSINKSFVNTVIETPILEKTFGNSVNALDEIASLAKNYKDTEDKDQYNYESLEILLKYKIITAENAKYLNDEKKINIPNIDTLIDKYKNISDS